MLEFDITIESDIVTVRNAAREFAGELNFSVTDKTRIAAAVSELARNALVHGGGGRMQLDTDMSRDSRGLRCVFIDKGPGIPDVELALLDGFSTLGRLGQGLPGARRLTDSLEIQSEPGVGTRVEIKKWP